MNCTAYGINPHEVTHNLTIMNSESHNNGLDGFVADAVVGGLYENNIAYDNDRHGFNIQNETTNLVLKDNEAYGNGYLYMYQGALAGGAGLTIQRGNIPPAGSTEIPWVSDIEISGGSYHDNGKEGILVKLSEQITITDVDIYGNERQGVKIEGSTDVTVQDSRISNNSQELDGKYDEINIRERFDDDYSQNTYYSHNTQILNNQISSTGDVNSRYGVREEPTNDDAGPTGTYVSGNTISGMDSGDISVPGYIWTGDAGDNAIAGTNGADTMAGGAGNDEYTVNHSGDLVTENAGEGTDHVYSSITYTLTPNVENLTLTGTGAINGYGNGLNNWIVGNAAVNTLKSDDGDDTLDGGGGADSLDGGNGNDTYYVDDAADVIVEKDSLGLGGYDHVFSSVSYVLSAQVEELTLTGSANLNATGNTGANVLNGNDGDNALDGHGGADTMNGGLGNDTYYVDHSGDVVNEAAGAGGGVDTVISSVSISSTKPLAANVENLVLTGLATEGTGNGLDNVITGNAQDNKLYGLDGNDTLDGGAGVDSLAGGAGDDVFILRKGEFQGDTIADFTGNDALAGDRIEFVGFSSQAILSYVGNGTWTVTDGSYSESFRVSSGAKVHASDHNLLSAPGPILNGDAGDNEVTGTSGADTMSGGAGNDTYYVNHSGDVVNEVAGAGIDTVISSVSNSSAKPLAANVENLRLIGLVIQGAGNELNNLIVGNDANNYLYGLDGDDTLDGGLGDDTLVGGGGTDTVIYAGKLSDYTIVTKNAERELTGSGIGTDTLRDIEILQFSDGRLIGKVWEPNPVDPGNPRDPGTPGDSGTPGGTGTPIGPGTPGNPGTPSTPGDPGIPAVPTEVRNGTSKANTLTGNDNINIMKGQGGNDVIKGRGADDKLYGGTGNDKVYGESGDDRVYGGAGNDKVYGDAGNDHVNGGGGHDTVVGGSGDDVIDGDFGNDILYGNAGSDAFVFSDKLGTPSTDRKVNFDTIKDFNVTSDSLWLDNAIFRKLGSGTSSDPGQLNKEFFVTGTKAREKDDYLIYNKKTGVLSYDADGSGSKEAVEFAQLSKNLKLTYKDFFVI
jgi:Ca2+-binding RTX toxin-like protein